MIENAFTKIYKHDKITLHFHFKRQFEIFTIQVYLKVCCFF